MCWYIKHNFFTSWWYAETTIKNVVVINFIEFIETDILKTLIRTSLKKLNSNIEEAILIFKKLLLFLLLYLKRFTSIYLPIYLYMFTYSQYWKKKTI